MLYAAGAAYVPPAIVSDPAAGFVQGDSWRAGAQWREIIVPESSNIANDISIPFTIWSPGQHMIPMMFEWFGFSLGQAVMITSLIFSAVGLLGLYRLCLFFKFSALLSTASLLCVALQRYFALPFAIYNGGEVLIFGLTPWVILRFAQIEKITLTIFLQLLSLLLLGVFCKLSFLIIALSLCALLVLKKKGPFSEEAASLRDVAKRGACIALLFGVLYGLLYTQFLMYGWNATHSSAESLSIHRIAKILLFVVASPLISAFSAGSMFNRLFSFPGEKLYETFFDCTPFLVFWATATVLFCVWAFRSKQLSLQYKNVLLALIGVHIVVYTYLIMTSPAVEAVERRFRMVGVLCIPGVLCYISSNRQVILRMVVGFGVLVSCFYGGASYWVRFRRSALSMNVGSRGTSHMNINKPALSHLWQLDDSLNGKVLFYIPSSEIALEVRKGRYIFSSLDFVPLSRLQKFRYRGTVENLVVMIPKKLKETKKRDAVLASFVDYDISKWSTHEEGDMVFYSQQREGM
jgi:hypothetical protein